MTNSFNLKDFMTANRETIIAKHVELTTENFYNGITLRDFMFIVYNRVAENCKSEKTASKYLPYAVMGVYNDNIKILGSDYRTDVLRAKYDGTAYMAMV